MFRQRYFRGVLQERPGEAAAGREERLSGRGEVDVVEVEAGVRRGVHRQVGGNVQGYGALQRINDAV